MWGSPGARVVHVPAPLDLLDHPTRDDLRVFLERLQRSGEPEVRLVARDGVLAVFGCTNPPSGLTDPGPVVLGMRAFALRPTADGEPPRDSLDVTVEGRALLDRLARLHPMGLELEIPPMTVAVAWAGVLPPRGGWEPGGTIDLESLREVAREGIARVAAALPQDPGDAVVRRVRREVWGTEIAPGLPAAAAFAAEMLGFLRGAGPATLARSRAWRRLSTEAGHVLVRGGAQAGAGDVR